MSLYGAIFGMDLSANKILSMINLPMKDIPRFTDVCINDEVTQVILTIMIASIDKDSHRDKISALKNNSLYLYATYHGINSNKDYFFKDFIFTLPTEARDKIITEMIEESKNIKCDNTMLLERMQDCINKMIKTAIGEPK